MCGIFVSVSRQGPAWPSERLQALLANRGPDSTGSRQHTFTFRRSGGRVESVYVILYSTVLALRGDHVVEQPVHTEGQDGPTCLCWNGEAWTINDRQPNGNDTRAIYELLNQRRSTEDTFTTIGPPSPIAAKKEASSVVEVLDAIAGPYSFAYLDGPSHCLYFGRDSLGRRSLMSRTDADGSVFISSVSEACLADGWKEVEADGINCLHFPSVRAPNEQGTYGVFQKSHIPYPSNGGYHKSGSVITSQFLSAELPSSPLLLSSRSPSVANLEGSLRASLKLRVTNIPEPPMKPQEDDVLPRAKLAVLFSGGLDCTVLARLCHDILPVNEPIDLLNVAFENPRIHKPDRDQATPPTNFYECCPDRRTGRASYSELQAVCSDRPWRFVAIDIPYAMTSEHRQQVMTLMHPHNTEMDLSIAYALYFASRGSGTITVDSHNASLHPVDLAYTTPARVLLSGLGADELFGGYQRHATAFNRKGFRGLHDELNLDITRLGSRNLGRDDRIFSNWARETRFPFLDEKLLGWAAQARIDEKCGYGEPQCGNLGKEDGSHLEPAKKALRCLAWKLGMRNVASEKKRAIQFGARTAKMEGGKTKGTDLVA
ncbi:asparagine synthase related protein [Polychaeton citri CBS 116435]|uniref:Asparagine synthase related protein n=1 Tax=Polychaeton citri CBS 116435 TaxID=1314669 RepID=A0A9P4QD85_9PEZI|nr:asparagine synthase related protein [Polychaeton citri CBS 116435]